ncbi:MAG: hypothetical protein A3I61_19795 [Acidobacteria bacterium RIFCSPLOWO2_02_FULL_68_18]|nr:MAG: hypothetical protein A3I61_19795 [Acidobacteria bacterium RIFCSPLOWO2_02_FULL_68_18]OFW48291.1 MAG: hypothetical protein A3G77_03340 [Acidobacteria bacterium RIFCSPLOWO2_12_FULL_68_19]
MLYLLSTCRMAAGIFVRKAITGSDRRLWRRYLLDRVGIFTGRRVELPKKPSIILFINAGEILGLTVFCATLRRLHPGHNLIFAIDNMESYVIGTELEIADLQIFAPWDFPWIGSWLRRWFRIEIAVFVTKIFHPVIAKTLRTSGVSVGLVSGHFGPDTVAQPANASYWRRMFTLRAYENLDYVAIQNEPQKRELLRHVQRPDVVVLGNIRADVSHAAATAEEQAAFRRTFSAPPGSPIVIAAATRGDEELIVEAFRVAREYRNDIRLVLLLRHLETAPHVLQRLSVKELEVTALSRMVRPVPVVVVDVPMAPAKLYSIASVIVFARTFHPMGGWANILEPAYHAKPVIFGTELKLWPDGLAELRQQYPQVCVTPAPRDLAQSLLYFLSEASVSAEVGQAFKRLTSIGASIAAANARFVFDRARGLRPGQPGASSVDVIVERESQSNL